MAQADVDAARLNVEFTQVRAPIYGLISRKYGHRREPINGGTGGTLLTTIVSTDPIYCYLEEDEQSYLRYSRLEREGIMPGSGERRKPGFYGTLERNGFIRTRATSTSSITGWTRILGLSEEGAYSPTRTTPSHRDYSPRMKIAGSEQYKAMLVPDEAVGSDQSLKFVFIVNPENTVEYRQVTLGPRMNGLRIVREGVMPEDRVIVKGLQRVQPGIKVDPVEEDIVVDEMNFLMPGS
ncbi:efflux RND transporter periplasmic adaptor subunit [Candidatus Kuenenia stuttgartiensis]|uniref:efflux RND transporter periplasmic adaptor subunit n=1 Tax=Kuenenia stuttgartiensis TaxID=174633 RepID=UPI00146ED009|nr:hypothetical protein [Candidatus Kuenenia stuttgartiensis]